MRVRLGVAVLAIGSIALFGQACSLSASSAQDGAAQQSEMKEPRVIIVGDTAFWSIFCYGGEPIEMRFASGEKPGGSTQRSNRCTDFTGIVAQGVNGEIEPMDTETNRRQRGYHFECGLHPHPKFGNSQMIAHHLFVFTEDDSALTMRSPSCRLISTSDGPAMFMREIKFMDDAFQAAPPPKPLTASAERKEVVS